MSDPGSIFARLMAVIEDRKANPPEKSYTTTLLAGGHEKIGEKIREEAAEIAAAVLLEPRPCESLDQLDPAAAAHEADRPQALRDETGEKVGSFRER